TPTPTPTVTPTPKPTKSPVKTETGGVLPDTSTPWNNLIGVGALLAVAGVVLWRRPGVHQSKRRIK
ncbi:MAG: LPXTG cell wall anchor domain-containing protein, partial [Actinobacteria bacterium]|nr:LPXTG cell wall anchor domain-containing protein [Actinomycetota bacterium]